MGIADSLFVLFLLVGGARAFVFSCDEAKYKLINSNLQEPTQFVCLVLAENYGNTDALKHIYAQVDKVSTSFAELASAQCIERPSKGAWRIVADNPVNLECDNSKEFALIFTTYRPVINFVPATISQTIVTTVLDSNSPHQLFVAPETGISLHKRQCTGSGNVSLSTGAGTGVAEYRYQISSWRCADLPDWITSFENVITVTLDADVQLTIDYAAIDYNHQTIISPSVRVAVESSGRSDNLQNKQGAPNVIRYDGGKELVATATCNPCTFDSRHDGLVRLTAYDDQWKITWSDVFRSADTYVITVGRYLEVDYETTPIAPQNIWENDDNFIVEISFVDNSPSQPVIGADAEEYCLCKLDKKFGMADGWDTTQIWIDVVIIIDTSEAMGVQGITDAITLIYSFFGTEEDDVLTTNTKAEFYTRVGLISMSDTPQTLYNLNMTKADKIDGKITMKTGLNQIDVSSAFNTAQQMLIDGRKDNIDRQNSRQVIYYMSNSDPPTVSEAMNTFKNERGIIIANNFIENGGIPRPGLEKMASPGYYYSDIQFDYMRTIQLFCKANCYCLPDKDSYPGQNPDPAVRASGGCFHAVPAGAQFANAKGNCAHGSGLIASVHDDQKGSFVNELIKTAAKASDYYWIGYSKSDAGWKWEDQSANPYVRWDVGEPSQASVSKCTYVDANSLLWGAGNCNVGFPFPCEYAPCSVGNKNCTIPA